MSRLSMHLASALLAAAALAGCGGGGGGSSFAFVPAAAPGTGSSNPPTPTNPAPQTSAYDQFLAYVLALVGTQQDGAEPADVAALDPAPTSETAEPIATP